MLRFSRFLSVLVVLMFVAHEARAEHAKINLDVTVGRETVSAHVDQTPRTRARTRGPC